MTIYLDNNATTPLDERVLAAMLPYLRERYGNPASATHAFGWEAEAAVEVAREELAAAIGAGPQEITFTSGATESDNLALLGSAAPGAHLISGSTEHPAVLDPTAHLERLGLSVTLLPVDEHGRVDPEDLREAITPETALVSVMLANNETGTLNPIRELAEIAHESGISFHTDAAQALGKVPLAVDELSVDLMSLSAHKCYGPKGAGALYVRRRPRRTRLQPTQLGGGQERGLRSGTLNVPGIVGFGRAAALAAEALPEESERIRALRDLLTDRLRESFPELTVNGHPHQRLPNTANLSLPGIPAGDLLAALSGVAVAPGSACASGSREVSHVLRAMGLSEGLARSAVRFSLGRFTTEAEVAAAADHVARSAAEVSGSGDYREVTARS